MAAVASLLEAFKMPLSEVYGRFRKSELGIMGWRSAEMSANMSRKFKDRAAASGGVPKVSDAAVQALEQRMGYVAEKATTSTGEIDLALLSGAEAMHYMRALGIPIGGRHG